MEASGVGGPAECRDKLHEYWVQLDFSDLAILLQSGVESDTNVDWRNGTNDSATYINFTRRRRLLPLCAKKTVSVLAD